MNVIKVFNKLFESKELLSVFQMCLPFSEKVFIFDVKSIYNLCD